MTDDLLRRIEGVFTESKEALTTREVAAQVGCHQDQAEQIIWNYPELFAWQPGGCWTLAVPKQSVLLTDLEPEQHDTREAVLDPPGAIELRAIALESGSVLRIIRRPFDSAAVFTVNQIGRDLQLVLNSAHPLFAALPMPFDDEEADGDHKRLVELLFASWAVQEGEATLGSTKRKLEDTRLSWGRALIKVFLSKRD